MHLTEEQAATKVCVQRRCNAGSGVVMDHVCIGSECMAWRWLDALNPQDVQLGYCGLAGEPTAYGPGEDE
jgi:hypothetical protein